MSVGAAAAPAAGAADWGTAVAAAAIFAGAESATGSSCGMTGVAGEGRNGGVAEFDCDGDGDGDGMWSDTGTETGKGTGTGTGTLPTATATATAADTKTETETRARSPLLLPLRVLRRLR